MTSLGKIAGNNLCGHQTLLLKRCLANTVPDFVVDRHRKSKLSIWKDPDYNTSQAASKDTIPLDRYRELYPEFLPNVKWFLRDKVKEKLERRDMFLRRAAMAIPEFYVGSILSVTMAALGAPEKSTRFVGICIERLGVGLSHSFTLRNVVDGMGVEITYQLYNPTLQNLTVLKLEKRLDDYLGYLRDAPPEFSTIPFDMEPVPLPRDGAVPVNPLVVKLNPPPWLRRWELLSFKGAVIPPLKEARERLAVNFKKPLAWEKFDLMKKYRENVRDDEAELIMHEVQTNSGGRRAKATEKFANKT